MASFAGLEGQETANPVEDFFQLTKTLLTAVSTTFPECDKTKEALAQMEFIESSNMESMKEVLIRKWYDTIKPYITDCVEKNDNVILRANIDILEKLDIKKKWSDPEFDQADKDVLWGYITSLTYLSCLYSESTPEQVQGLATAASRLAETAQFEISEDGKFSFNIKAFQAMINDEASQGDIGELMKGMAPLMGALGGGGGDAAVPSGLQSFLASQMGNFASMLPK